MASERESLLLRGVLDLCVMSLMNTGTLYGYEVVGRLSELGLSVAPGSVYPLLARLERKGLVTAQTQPSEVGPPRRWWQLTSVGEAALAEGRTQWRHMSGAIDSALNLPALREGSVS